MTTRLAHIKEVRVLQITFWAKKIICNTQNTTHVTKGVLQIVVAERVME